MIQFCISYACGDAGKVAEALHEHPTAYPYDVWKDEHKIPSEQVSFRHFVRTG